MGQKKKMARICVNLGPEGLVAGIAPRPCATSSTYRASYIHPCIPGLVYTAVYSIAIDTKQHSFFLTR